MTKALVVLSGGQDSSTCLAIALQRMAEGRFTEVQAITFDYGQRHKREVACALDMTEQLEAVHGLKVEHEVVDLSHYGDSILVGSSPLVNRKQDVETYASAEVLPGGLEKTFVPMRNALFLIIAANRAVAMGLEGEGAPHDVVVFTGVSQEDYGGYPDCREPFIHAIENALREAINATEMPDIRIETPLLHVNKASTVEIAESIPYGRWLNSFSHTCYNGEWPPCGKCHACLLRAKGYDGAGYIDPIMDRGLKGRTPEDRRRPVLRPPGT